MRVATQAGGGDFMDYHDAVTEVLEKASRIILPGEPVDVVASAEREYEKRGACDAKFIEPIERSLRERLQEWTAAQKNAIWRSTETGQANELGFDDCDIDALDLFLEDELMHHIIERLSGGRTKGDLNEDDDDG